MNIFKKLKQLLLSNFREILLYHYTSLEFRAKIFALIISANENAGECEIALVEKIGMDIYNDENRANVLSRTTKEFVSRVKTKNGYYHENLIREIVAELKVHKRYAQKITIEAFRPLIACHNDEDTRVYQERILEFLEKLKQEHT